MKKFLITTLMMIAVNITFAKKVKFAVDMTGIAISPLGMHIAGDFQTVAGFAGGDWASGTTPLTQETADTNIYSIVVDIPAFAKYEYKFVNGDQFYEAEFVPVESRVGYDFNDNRWIYVDSLANDTTFLGAIRFAANAPAGLVLMRTIVNMQNESSVASQGVHIAGDFQGADPSKTILYSFGAVGATGAAGIWEVINFVTAGAHTFKYINGNTSGAAEVVPGACAVGGERSMDVPHDSVLAVVCFSSCSACSAAGIEENLSASKFEVYPNPANEYTTLKFNDGSAQHSVIVKDMAGRVIRSYNAISGTEVQIDRDNLTSGIYLLNVLDADNSLSTAKLIIQ